MPVPCVLASIAYSMGVASWSHGPRLVVKQLEAKLAEVGDKPQDELQAEHDRALAKVLESKAALNTTLVAQQEEMEALRVSVVRCYRVCVCVCVCVCGHACGRVGVWACGRVGVWAFGRGR